jgi:hypothetical protein
MYKYTILASALIIMVVMSAYCKAANDVSESEESDILTAREALLANLFEQAFEKRIVYSFSIQLKLFTMSYQT